MTGRLQLFRALATYNIPSVTQISLHSLHLSQQPSSSSTAAPFSTVSAHPYQEPSSPPLSTVPMQWDEGCFNSLFASEVGNDTTVEDLCHCNNDTSSAVDPFQSLTFVDANMAPETDEVMDLHVPSLPWTFSLLLRSGTPACGDILDATLFETDLPLYSATRAPTQVPTAAPTHAPTSLNDTASEASAASKDEVAVASDVKSTVEAPVHRATQATVVAQEDGTYKVSATIVSPGTHELMVGV